MPSVLLPVPHFEQAEDGTCLPACVRMILAYWDKPFTEEQLAQLLGTKSFGTPFFHLERLQSYGFEVSMTTLSAAMLKQALQEKHPVIVRVWTPMLDYWQTDTPHVVTVIGFDEVNVYLNDPAYSDAPKTVSWTGFLAAWAEFDETSAIIHP